MFGKGFLVEHDYAGKSLAEAADFCSVFEFEQGGDGVIGWSQRDAFVQNLVQRRATEKFKRQQFGFGLDALPEKVECVGAETKFSVDLSEYLA